MRGGWYHGYAAKADDLERKGRRTLRQAGLATWLTSPFTFVLPARSSPTTTRPRKTVWRCAATGPTSARACAIKPTCTTGKERRISRWEHEHILEAVQRRLDEHPEKMRQRRETVEHPFGRLLKEPDSELRCRRRPCPRRSTARQRRESNRPSPSDRALGNRDTSNCIQAGRPRWLPANSWP